MTLDKGRKVWKFASCTLILTLLLCRGCSSKGDGKVKIKSIPLKLSFTAAKVGMDLLFSEENKLGLSTRDILASAFADTEPSSGLPPGDVACLMVVKGREVRYWK